ncbi:hypothetical protein HAZT_HAZT007679 [Hyalella azteca]|uniref:Uncharacterized protein n=1 Tax=Hyalella azteca TaxID=294128 RepID=A0A6A0H133_HYAAZ|nr:hypothetical protein HAZT_HAZT007679 [Hyalella azteca]
MGGGGRGVTKSVIRCMASSGSKTTAPSKASTASTIPPPYQSPATPNPGDKVVGPGASKSGEYKCSEYYCYNKSSYFDLEAEMVKDRIPQPVADNGKK